MDIGEDRIEYIFKKVRGDCAVFPGTVTITITYEKINDGEKISKVYMQCGWQEN